MNVKNVYLYHEVIPSIWLSTATFPPKYLMMRRGVEGMGNKSLTPFRITVKISSLVLMPPFIHSFNPYLIHFLPLFIQFHSLLSPEFLSVSSTLLSSYLSFSATLSTPFRLTPREILHLSHLYPVISCDTMPLCVSQFISLSSSPLNPYFFPPPLLTSLFISCFSVDTIPSASGTFGLFLLFLSKWSTGEK